jgi:hypothetical protein
MLPISATVFGGPYDRFCGLFRRPRSVWTEPMGPRCGTLAVCGGGEITLDSCLHHRATNHRGPPRPLECLVRPSLRSPGRRHALAPDTGVLRPSPRPPSCHLRVWLSPSHLRLETGDGAGSVRWPAQQGSAFLAGWLQPRAVATGGAPHPRPDAPVPPLTRFPHRLGRASTITFTDSTHRFRRADDLLGAV